MTDMFAELAGSRVEEGRITVPYLGCYHADVTVDGKGPFASSGLVLTVAGLKLTCSPYRPPITFQGKTRIRLIAGYGGWRKTIKAKGYKLAAGVKLSLVLGDAAKECGERITVAEDRELGKHYARDEAPAARGTRGDGSSAVTSGGSARPSRSGPCPRERGPWLRATLRLYR